MSNIASDVKMTTNYDFEKMQEESIVVDCNIFERKEKNHKSSEPAGLRGQTSNSRPS
jgi:hypothetical protein